MSDIEPKPKIKTKKKLVADLFPKRYVANGGNASAAYKSIRPGVTNSTAGTEGYFDPE